NLFRELDAAPAPPAALRGRVMIDHGLALHAAGRLNEARDRFQQALGIDHEEAGSDDAYVAFDQLMLAALLRDVGEPEAARDSLEKARAAHERFFGKEHPIVARALGRLVGVLHDLGDTDAALSAGVLASTINERAFGPAHPNHASDLAYTADV